MSRPFSEDDNAHLLLMRIKRGDNQAQAELYALFAWKFYRFARSKGLSHEDAEDAVQNTFNRIIEKINTYQAVTQSGSRWMWRICQHVIADMFRSKERDAKKLYKLTDTLNEALLLADENPVHSSVEENERKEARRRAWNSISREDRLTILSRFENPDSTERTGKRGPTGRKWEEAVKRLREGYQKNLKKIE